MPILDGDQVLSKAQAVTTGTTQSTNVFDFGAARVGHNNKVIVTVNTAVASVGNATVSVVVKTDDNAAMSSPKTLITTAAIAKATLVAGYRVLEFTLPHDVERFVAVDYVVGTADLTAGKFNAYIDYAVQTNGVI